MAPSHECQGSRDVRDCRDFRIRPAAPEDRPAIEACAQAAFGKYVPRMGMEPAPMGYDYGARIERDSVFAGECAGRVVGFLMLGLRDDALFLNTVALLPDFQGKGFGRAFMAFAEDVARREGKPEIVLYTNVRMTENQAFYRASGYEEYDRRSEDGFERVYYRKIL